MKKKIAIILVLVFILSSLFGCRPVGDKVNLDDLQDFLDNNETGGTGGTGGGNGAKDVTIYLVAGVGHTVGGKSGQDFEELHLENAFKLTLKSGAALPTADSSDKLEFVGWSYPVGALANPVKVAPKKDNAVLYALFSLIGASGDDPGDNPDEDKADFYMAFNGALDENTRFVINHTPVVPDSKEFYFTRAFTLNEEFTFVSKNAMEGIVKGDECVYPTSGNRGFTFNWDNANKIKTSDYFAAVNVTQTGTNPDHVWANVSSPELKCIKAGTYTLYVTVYDNGWVAMFAKPVV